MENLRKKINKVDKKIAKLLIKRFTIVKQIGIYKKNNNIQVYDKNREELVLKKIRSFVNNKLPPNSIENIYTTIMNEAKKIQLENK
ncbi:MAG: chorismate mutase [Mycoplasmataceae bacterium]|jgi:monofunctional chorismate mutase|nr:chorismate mutase [Mycoplasmataceae bacterium]